MAGFRTLLLEELKVFLSPEEIRYWARTVTVEVQSLRFLSTCSHLGSLGIHTQHIPFKLKSSLLPAAKNFEVLELGKGLRLAIAERAL